MNALEKIAYTFAAFVFIVFVNVVGHLRSPWSDLSFWSLLGLLVFGATLIPEVIRELEGRFKSKPLKVFLIRIVGAWAIAAFFFWNAATTRAAADTITTYPMAVAAFIFAIVVTIKSMALSSRQMADANARARYEGQLSEAQAADQKERERLNQQRLALEDEWREANLVSAFDIKQLIEAELGNNYPSELRPLIHELAFAFTEIKIDRQTATPAEALSKYEHYAKSIVAMIREYQRLRPVHSFPPGSFPYQHAFTDDEQYELCKSLSAALKTKLSYWRAGPPLPLGPASYEYLDKNGDVDDRRWDAAFARHDKEVQKILQALPREELVFVDTPMFHKGRLLPRTEMRPLLLEAETRFLGQWIIGPPMAGKTTFISTMIANDLQKVARNEASIFVMDSQNELVTDIARLEMFAPGRPLHGKLIYLEPHPDFPLALNIFDINKQRASSLSSAEERMMYEAGVEWMVSFFLKSLVKSEETGAQETFLAYVIPAVLAIPNATIFTLQELLEPAATKNGPTGYDRFAHHFNRLRPATQKWLKERLHSEQLKPTREAIRGRLDGFVARGFFGDMFAYPKNKLDLFEELQSSKVILINTKGALLRKNLEPFGRYFIARLLQAAEERMFTERRARLPVYAYIDEAHDYIAEEDNIEELINKARKQKVGLIVANQMESQITSLLVRDALGRMAIQCCGEPPVQKNAPPTWYVKLGKQETVQISVPNTQFKDMPQMSDADFSAMLADMRRRFSSGDIPKQPRTERYNNDVEWMVTLSARFAQRGGLKRVHGLEIRIPAGMKDGHRMRLRGAAKNPDGSRTDVYVTFRVIGLGADQERPRSGLALGSDGLLDDEKPDDADAKPW